VPSKLESALVTADACETGTANSAIATTNSQTIFFFMKFSSGGLVSASRTSLKVIENTLVQRMGVNLLRIRSTADSQ
jgi:hypothetical protein